MLIDFTVENYRSYRESKCLSLMASAASELPENLFALDEPEIKLLRCAAIYGSNASGKSNLLAAMHLLAETIDSPTSRAVSYRFSFSPFALDLDSGSKPCSFRVRFVAEGILYEYCLAINPEGVQEEKLSAFPLGREQVWFHRVAGSVPTFGTHLKGQKQSLFQVTAANIPFLTVAAAFDHPQLSPPARWIIGNLRNRLGGRQVGRWRVAREEEITAKLMHDDIGFRRWVNEFVQYADVVHGVDVEVTTEIVKRPIVTKTESGEFIRADQELQEKHYDPYFYHKGEGGVIAKLGLADQSLGTRRLFSMLAPFYEVLRDGQLAVVDELSASLHPAIVREIVKLFHNPQTNRRGAQLVFATHDTTLLTGRLLRRDQVWLTEKAKSGATDLYSLSDIKGVRDTEAFEKGYLRGRYGAIPFFGRFDFPEIPTEPEAPEKAQQEPAE